MLLLMRMNSISEDVLYMLLLIRMNSITEDVLYIDEFCRRATMTHNIEKHTMDVNMPDHLSTVDAIESTITIIHAAYL